MVNYNFDISLIPITDCDTDKLREWRNEPEIYKWCRQHSPREVFEHNSWLKSLETRNDVKMFAIRTLGNDNYYEEVVGVCGLTSIDLINAHAEFSLYIAKPYQGLKYGEKALRTLVKYAFNVLRINHIFGETFNGNHAAKIFEKVGFKLEGTRRGFYYREGKFIDAHIYSILKDELI